MQYYNVRFNVYKSDEAPVEKEEWLCLNEHYDDEQMKLYLSVRHNASVTIISSVVIGEEQYKNKQRERY